MTEKPMPSADLRALASKAATITPATDPCRFGAADPDCAANEHIAQWSPARALVALDIIQSAEAWVDAPLGERGDSSRDEIAALNDLFTGVKRWREVGA